MKTKKITLSANHTHGSVGPMTGIISASMPVLVTKDMTFGNISYSTFNEGGGKVLWFGSVEKETIDRLRYMRDEFGPIIKRVIKKMGRTWCHGGVPRLVKKIITLKYHQSYLLKMWFLSSPLFKL